MTEKTSTNHLTEENSYKKIKNKDVGIERILEIINRLTDEHDGCPWDKIQTNITLAKHTIEEAYEVADAIESRSNHEICQELGDLLFNILFHIHIATQNGSFTLTDVFENIVDKMITRHPHVFKEKKSRTVDEVNEQWEEIKRTERKIGGIGEIEKELNNITVTLPALTHSMKIQEKVARIGFDWDASYQIINKIYEEIDEFIEAEEKNIGSEKLGELGDILFSVVNLARYSDIEPETALRATNRKFVERVIKMEKLLNKNGKEIKTVGGKELNVLWQEIKRGQ